MAVAELDRLRFFADVPDLSAVVEWPQLEEVDDDTPAPPTSRVQVARLGKFKHPKYGTFSITPKTFDSMIQNFAAGIPTDRLPIDFDHTPDLGGSTEACGWITGLAREGDGLYADVEWRWEGAYAIRDEAYRYVSPTWSMSFVDDAGEAHGPTLLAFACTNRPFFSGLGTVSLSQRFSRDEVTPCEQVDESETAPEPSDSPAAMEELTKIATALGLDEEADTEAVLTAAQELSAKAETAPGEGQVLIAKADLDALKAAQASESQLASRLESLETEARETRFDQAFSKALTEGRAVPAQREQFSQLWDANEELAKSTIDSLQKVVSMSKQGGRGDDADAPDGVDQDAFTLDREVKAFMAEHDEEDYTKALDKVLASRQVAA